MLYFSQYRLRRLELKMIVVHAEIHVMQRFIQRVESNPRECDWHDYKHAAYVLQITKANMMSRRTCMKFLRLKQEKMRRYKANFKKILKKRRACVRLH